MDVYSAYFMVVSTSLMTQFMYKKFAPKICHDLNIFKKRFAFNYRREGHIFFNKSL